MVVLIFTSSISSVSASSDTSTKIPSWIKNNAKWWSEGQIDDSDFTKGIEYLIDNGIMVIPTTASASNESSQGIPSWIKNNAGWWATDKITDDEFTKGMQYLVSNGIVSTTQSLAAPTIEMKEYNSTNYHFVATIPNGPTGDYLVTILPNQKYTPSNDELEGSNGLAIYNVQYTQSKTDDTFSYTLSYFVPYSALPSDVASALQSQQTSTNESEIPPILLAVLSPRTSHPVYIQSTTVPEQGESGISVTITSLIENTASEFYDYLAHGHVKWQEAGTILDAAINVKESFEIKGQYEEYTKILDEAEKCVNLQQDGSTLKSFEDPTKTSEIYEIDKTRSDIKSDTAARFGGLMLGTASSLTGPGVLVLAPGFAYLNHGLKESDDEKIQHIKDIVKPCEPPTHLVAKGYDKRVDLTWTHPNKSPPSPITKYNIYRAESSGAYLTAIASTDVGTTRYTDRAVQNEKTYYYTVTAVNKAGESGHAKTFFNKVALVSQDQFQEIIKIKPHGEEMSSSLSNEVFATPAGGEWTGKYEYSYHVIDSPYVRMGLLITTLVDETGSFTFDVLPDNTLEGTIKVSYTSTYAVRSPPEINGPRCNAEDAGDYTLQLSGYYNPIDNTVHIESGTESFSVELVSMTLKCEEGREGLPVPMYIGNFGSVVLQLKDGATYEKDEYDGALHYRVTLH